jgi:hypothetical protein
LGLYKAGDNQADCGTDYADLQRIGDSSRSVARKTIKTTSAASRPSVTGSGILNSRNILMCLTSYMPLNSSSMPMVKARKSSTINSFIDKSAAVQDG